MEIHADGFIAVEKSEDDNALPVCLLPVGAPPITKSFKAQTESYLTKYLRDETLYSDAHLR